MKPAWVRADLSHCVAFFCDVFVGGTLSNPGKPEAFRRVVMEKQKRRAKDYLRRAVDLHDLWVREELERAGKYLRAADRNFYDAQRAADGAKAQREADAARRPGYPTSWDRIDAGPLFGAEDPACSGDHLREGHVEPAVARDDRRSAWDRIDAEEGAAGCTDDGVPWVVARDKRGRAEPATSVSDARLGRHRWRRHRVGRRKPRGSSPGGRCRDSACSPTR